MKKRVIAVYALIGLLALGSTTLTSCVDDNESASVTAIRDAKAAQLNALAKYNEEQANATKILAEADAAIKNAKAAYQKALAEGEQAKADLAKATLELDIKAAKAKAEAELNANLAELERSKADLLAAIGSMAEAQANKANQLIQAMDGLTAEIHQLNTDLITANYNKTNAEFELANKEILKTQEENANNVTIANNEALIAEYEKYSTEDRDAAIKAADAAEAEAEGLSTQSADLLQKLNTAMNTATAAYDKLRDTPFMQNVDRSFLTDATPDAVEYTIDFGDGTISNMTKWYDQKWEVDADAVKGLTDQIAVQEKEVTTAGLRLTEAQKALTDKKATQEYKDAVAAVDAAQKAYDEATTADDKEMKWQALQSAKSALAVVTAAEETAVENATNAKEYAEEWLADLKQTQAYVNDADAYAAYAKLYDEYVALRDAQEEAQIAWMKVNHNYQIKNALATNLRNVANGMTNYAQLIDDCNTAINNAKQNNSALEAVDTQKEMIAYYDNQIKSLNAQIEVKNQLYTQYETALKQVMEGQLPTLPETPGEGGGSDTETPAE